MQTLDPLAVLVMLIIFSASVVWFILPFIRGLREKRNLSKSNRKSNEVSLISPSPINLPRKLIKRFAIFNPIKKWAIETKTNIATKLAVYKAPPTENKVPSRESVDSPTVDESRKESSSPSHEEGSDLSPGDVPVLQPVLIQLSPEDIALANELSSNRKESKEELSEPGYTTTRPDSGNRSTVVDEIEISNIASARYYRFFRDSQ